MSQVHQTSYIPVLDDLDLRQFMKNARKAHRKAHPDQVKRRGRVSEETVVLEAIKIIFLSGVGYSKRWSQERWTDEIIKIVNSMPNTFPITRRTIQKHLKEIYKRNLFPLHMIPASFVKNLTQEQQTSHWLAVAWAEAIVEVQRAGSSPSTFRVEYKDVLNRHHQLLDKYKVPRST